VEKGTSAAAFRVCGSSGMLAAKDPDELHLSYRRKHSILCYSLVLSLDYDRQTVSSDVGVRAADSGLDWWIPAHAVRFLFEAWQQSWKHPSNTDAWWRGVKTVKQLPVVSVLLGC